MSAPIELYRDPQHVCLMFSDLFEMQSEAVQCNQFLVVNNDEGALIDPGGNLAFNELYLGMTRYFSPQKLTYLVASHTDPDIIASLDRWMTSTRAQVVISRLWERFVPHFAKVGKTEERVIGVPDSGGKLPLGRSELWFVPAHFMHAEGNFHFYDPISRILFTGDLGVSLVTARESQVPVTSLAPHIPHMEGFHRRYMAANKVLRLWAQMARKLDISMLVPQHGAPIAGPAIGEFFDWVESLSCGVDLMDESNYQLPTERIDPVTRTMIPG